MTNFAKNFTLVLLAFAMLTGFAMGDVIKSVTFETATGYTTSIAEFSDGYSDYFTRTDGSTGISSTDISNIQGSYYFGAMDIDGEGATLPVTLTLENVDIASFTDLALSVYLAEDDAGDANQDWDATDYLHIDYEIDGGGYNNLIHVESPLSTNGEPKIDTNFDGIGNGTSITNVFAQFSANITGTGSLLNVKFTFNLNSGDEDIAIDNIEITGTSAGGVLNPTGVTATTVSSTQINLTWTDNASGDDVMVVFDSDGSFTDPVDGVSYSGSALGGTVIYQGTAEAYNHSSLSANTAYYYKFWSVDASDNYSPGTTQNATTAKAEPAAHVTDLAATSDHNTVSLTWTDATADGYIIKASSSSLGAITDPVDGTAESNDVDLSDGSGVYNASPGDETYSWEGLSAETTYYFKVYPYNNSSTLIDYKTDGTVPSVSKATTAAPVTNPPAADDVVITELCDDGSGGYMSGFMEIYNNTSTIIDMEGAYIERIASDGSYDGYTYTFAADVTIPANGFLIVARGQVEATFESDWSVDLSANNANYDAGDANLYFTTGRSYKLYTSGDALIDTTIVVDANLRSIQSSDVWSATESDANGTPAALDDGQVTEVPLPITLTSFTAKAKNGVIELAWETASETENARFVIYRNDIAIAAIEGAGTTSEPSSYRYMDAEVVPGVAYTYVLADVDYANTENKYDDDAVTVTLGNDVMEADFVVGAAYPNPFNPSTIVPFELTKDAMVQASVYDLVGREVKTLVNGNVSAGSHELKIDGRNMTTGIYLVKIVIDNTANIQKIALMK